MRRVTDGIHVFEAPQRFYGIEVGARMTVLATDRGWVVHSPIAVPPEEVRALGSVRGALSPNLLHHLYAGAWIEAGVPTWAAPGLSEKRPDLRFEGTIEEGVQPFGPEIELFPLRCFSMTNEVVLFHRPSGTLVVTDLVFHFGPDAPWMTRASMTLLGGYPGCCITLLERFGVDRARARQEIGALLQLDFDRLIMAHGRIIESGGKEALHQAWRWLGV